MFGPEGSSQLLGSGVDCRERCLGRGVLPALRGGGGRLERVRCLDVRLRGGGGCEMLGRGVDCRE